MNFALRLWVLFGLLTISASADAQQATGLTPQIQSQKVEFVVYDCRHKAVAAVERLLRPLLSSDDAYQLFTDSEKNKLYLRASSESQNIAKQLIKSIDRPASDPQPGESTEKKSAAFRDGKLGAVPQGKIVPSQPKNFPRAQDQRSPKDSQNNITVEGKSKKRVEQSSLEIVTRFVMVNRADIDFLEKQLTGVFERNLNIVRNDGREIYVVAVAKSEKKVEVEFDRRRSGVLVSGDSNVVEQMVKLCDALSKSRNVNGRKTKVFRLQKQNQPEIRKLIKPVSDPRKEGSHLKRSSRILPVDYVFQDDDPQVQPEGTEQPPQQEPSMPIRQFQGVEIESMPDLDVIILRGREQDLDQLEDIIKQIEKISRETQPVVQVYILRNTGSDAVSQIIAETRDDLVGGRQGKVSITPLVKPNGLLLIGWGEAVEAVKDLIRQLDVPVDAKTQFQVYRIEHASATQISAQLESFFGGRGGLGPQVSGTVDERTNSIIVYASPRDMDEVSRMIRELDIPGGMAVNRTQIIKIRNALAADVAQTLESAIEAASSNSRTAVMELLAFNEKGQQILRSGTLGEVQITPNLRNNTLIVTSPKENFNLIEELIRQLDTPASKSQLKIFKIYNSDASTLIQTLRSLIPGSVSGSANLKLPTAPDEISLTPLRFSVDVRSNSILATGSEGDLRIAEALIAKLDESTSSKRTTEVYQLKNSPAVDVANAINQFLQSSRQIDNAAPGSQNPFQELDREVIVVPEPIANKLLVSATSRYFEEINGLIEKLDEQPPQVMIQVLIAEVILNDTDEFGIEVGLQDSVLFDRSLLGDLVTTASTASTSTAAGIVTTTDEIIQAASNIPGFNFNSSQPLGNSGSTQAVDSASAIGQQGISNFSVGRTNEQLGFGGLVLSASSQNVSLLLRALQESRRVDILSRPQVRTLDNQPAFIQIGQRVPRITGSTVNQNGQSNSVALENIGLILGVTPRISSDGRVVMEIDAEKSNLGTEQDGVPVAVSTDGTIIRSPRVDTTTAQATVSAADGETIVLGGLITKNRQQVSRSVPYLNQVPLLKNFFKYEGEMVRRSELMIILTPRVIRTAEDNARIRQIETSRLNWCAADVFEIHGEIDAVESVDTDQLDASKPEVIYPVENPRGQRLTGKLQTELLNRIGNLRDQEPGKGRFRVRNRNIETDRVPSPTPTPR
ncbi:MAG: secretin N-terminal domain-containing protein [Planctomycetota bacterium]|nr:secretin N-terminal domain-containing protein [Planctomycetota bacterium]